MIYSPILRAKAGELSALAGLSPHARVMTRPILDLPPPGDGMLLEEHLSLLARSIAQSWGTRDAIAIDLSLYGPEQVVHDGRHAVEYFFMCARQARLYSLPVSGPTWLRGPGDVYTNAIAAVVRTDCRGGAVRLPLEDFAEAGAFGRAVDDALTSSGLLRNEVDLILDVGSLEILPEGASSEQAITSTVREVLAAVGSDPFRSVSLVASSVPRATPRNQGTAPLIIRRREFDVWRALHATPGRQRLCFGDYGVVYAMQSDPTGPLKVPRRVRLSTATHHHFFKAQRRDYRGLATIAAATPAFAEQPLSLGKREVHAAAIGVGDIGNPTQWVARDTNMHIEKTVTDSEKTLRESGSLKHLNLADEQRVAWLQSNFLDS
jgi:hypothetical protein